MVGEFNRTPSLDPVEFLLMEGHRTPFDER
jgi:hypothetical protein